MYPPIAHEDTLMVKEVRLTPMLRQYMEVKERHKDKLILFRMGDFYETFFDDAREVSRILNITLTSRNHGKDDEVPLAGIPHHALSSYANKLTKAGKSYVIVEQTEDPKMAKGLVKRDVVEIVTPGTTLSETFLDSKQNNFLVGISINGDVAATTEADLSTGEFRVTEFEASGLFAELRRIGPAEVVAARSWVNDNRTRFEHEVSGTVLTPLEDWVFGLTAARERLLEHFRVTSLKGFGAEHLTAGTAAAGAVLSYLQDNQLTQLGHVRRLHVVNRSEYLVLDETSQRNLELFQPLMASNRTGTLIAHIDATATPMGGRLLRQWLVRPLKNRQRIDARLDAIGWFIDHELVLDDTRAALGCVKDIERLTARICCGRGTPRDVAGLAESLEAATPVRELVAEAECDFLRTGADLMADVDDVVQLIRTNIVEDAPVSVTDGSIIRDGVSPELDELRRIGRGGKEWITNLQVSERERTSIPSLKIGYNRAFGYYIEVSNAHRSKVPEEYDRKQTLVNAERYITPELKEWEAKVLSAEEQSIELERTLFLSVREAVAARSEDLLNLANGVAQVDCIAGLAETARKHRYCRPEIRPDDRLRIENSRHPVVERLLNEGSFVPNDVKLDNDENQILVITGPNMAGKSTYLRQVGLIIILAHMGSWVPATSAEIGLVDQLFTRVGAQDNLAAGESTFLVEMHETANILNNATPRSVVLFDEVGRGTSTFDGLSLAWSIVEYLHNTPHRAAKTMFATHYHELVDLEEHLARVKNYNVAVREWHDEVVFLRKIVPGGCDHSYGIHVAGMAGLPEQVLRRARAVLKTLEEKEHDVHEKLDTQPPPPEPEYGNSTDQISLFGLNAAGEHPVLKELRNLDLLNTPPLDVMRIVDNWQKGLEDGRSSVQT